MRQVNDACAALLTELASACSWGGATARKAIRAKVKKVVCGWDAKVEANEASLPRVSADRPYPTLALKDGVIRVGTAKNVGINNPTFFEWLEKSLKLTPWKHTGL